MKGRSMPRYAKLYRDMLCTRKPLPWQINKIFVIGLQCLTRRRFAAICALGKSYISAGKPGEPGKSRQIAAMDGSQMVVEISGSYYRFHLPS